MDFIPSLNATKRKISKSTSSKLSLKSRRQYTQSQSCSQVEEDSFKNDGSSLFLSQPSMSSNIELVPSTKAHDEKPIKSTSKPESKNVEKQPSPKLMSEVDSNCTEDPQTVSRLNQDSDSPFNDSVEIIDLASTPEDDPEVGNKTESIIKKTVALKPSLDKIKQLRTKSEMVPEKDETEVKSNLEEKIHDNAKETVQSNKVQTKYKPKPKSKQGTRVVDSNEYSNDDDIVNNQLEGKTRFASKLVVFEKQEPKKFTFEAVTRTSPNLNKGTSEEEDVQDLSLDSNTSCGNNKSTEISKVTEIDSLANKSTKLSGNSISPVKLTSSPGCSELDPSQVSDNFKVKPIPNTLTSSTITCEVNKSPVKQDTTVETKATEAVSKDNTEELPCPVCNKPAGKNRRAHMKSCAAKNNVTTVQLLQAIELQEKQAAERRALGLPAVVSSLNQKVFVKKKAAPRVAKDPSMELALALSKSLMEAQEQDELRETRRLLGDQEDFGWETPAAIPQITAPGPSSASSGQLELGVGTSGTVQLLRPTNPTNTARRGRSGRGVDKVPSMLLRTSKEDRVRRITEKVAMLLLADEEAVESTEQSKTVNVPTLKLSSKLKKLRSNSSELWNLAAVSPSIDRNAFYVAELSDFISPTKHEVGSKLRHLSQIPGRIKTPEKDILTSSHHSKKSTPVPGSSQVTSKSSTRISMSPTRRPTPPSVPTRRIEGTGLSRDWAALLNSSTLSDVTVYVNGEKRLRAHKLVLVVRCPAMLEDIALELSPRGKGCLEQMLLWGDVSKETALAMLEFLYCDTTIRTLDLEQTHLEELAALAERYNVKELLQHVVMLAKIRTSLCGSISPHRKKKMSVLPPKPALSQTSSFTNASRRSVVKTPEKSNADLSLSSPMKSYSKLDLSSPVKLSAEASLSSPLKSGAELHLQSPSKSNVELNLSSPVNSKPSPSTQRSISPDLFEDDDPDMADGLDDRPDIAYLVSMIEKSQSSRLSQNKMSPENSESQQLKRKNYTSPSVSESSSKKLCKDTSYCRKNLLSELEKSTTSSHDSISSSIQDKGNSPTYKMHEMSSTQILDMLENDPIKFQSKKISSNEVEMVRSEERLSTPTSPIIDDIWNDFEHVACIPVSPNVFNDNTPEDLTVNPDTVKSPESVKSPGTVITISSTTTSQNSRVSTLLSPDSSSSQEENRTVINAMDDSLGAFIGADLSNLEKAALNAYSKVVSPLQSSTPQERRKSNAHDVTPLPDYSIMESPALQKELDKYGIRRLRRNQAKLILRHIYNELHPLIPDTPGVDNRYLPSPISSKTRGGARAPRVRGRRGGSSSSSRTVARPAHNMSLSQPDPAKDDDSLENCAIPGPSRKTHNISLSQPMPAKDNPDENDSSYSDLSSTSDVESNEDSDSSPEFEDPELMGYSASQTLDCQDDVRQAMSQLIASNPNLHHRLLMYEPIWLEELQTLLRQNGAKCNPKFLLDYLDDHCLTFRVPRPQRTGRGTKKKRSPKKAGSGTQRGSSSSPQKAATASQCGTRGRRRKGVQPDAV